MSGAATIRGLEEQVSIWQKGAHGEFQMSLQRPVASAAEAFFNQIAPSFPSNYVTENFPGLFGSAELEAFKGEIPYSGLDNYDNSIVSSEWARGFKVKWRDLRADQKNLALLQNLPSILAMKARKVKFKNLATLLENNPTWTPDGATVFNDAHFFGDNNLSLNVADPTNPTEYEWQLILDTIWNEIGQFTDDHGQTLNEYFDVANLLLIGPAKYMASARNAQRRNILPYIVGTDKAVTGLENINQGTWGFWPFPRLDNSANVLYWVLLTPEDQGGNPLGKSVPLLRTEFTPYELTVANANPEDPEFRNRRSIEMNVYGEEGLGVIDAMRVGKFSLT